MQSIITRLNDYGKAVSIKTLLLYIACVFLMSHLFYFLVGIRFDDRPAHQFWQFLDPALLRDRLAESILYLHIQPPLFNLFVGLVFKFFPENETIVFHIIYIAIGWVVCSSMFLLQIRLGVSKFIAFILTILFVISPSFILYEHWLYYTFPVTAILVSSGLYLYKAVEAQDSWYALAFFSLLLLLGGLRSLFHISHYVFLAAVFIVARRPVSKKVVISVAMPFLILLSFYVKNFVLFDHLTTTTWTGMNIWSVTGQNMPLNERQALVDEGKLSKISLINKFSLLKEYPPEYIEAKNFKVKEYKDIASLSQITKSTGENNYNHIGYIAISDQYFKDNLYIMAHHPKVVMVGIIRALVRYFRSATDNYWLVGNREKVTSIRLFYDYWLYGKVNLSQYSELAPYTKRPHLVCLYILIGLPLLICWSLRVVMKGHSVEVKFTNAQRVVILYLCFNIVYVAVIGNLFEMGENNRVRFTTDPLSFVLLGVFLHNSVILSRLGRALRAGVGYITSQMNIA